MRLAANLVYQGAGELARAAEELDYGVVLSGEGYRNDAVSVLGLAAGRTRRIGLASGIMQIPARPPGLAALTAATLDALSGGRFRLGLGVSNPDVSDGWYGVPFDKPLARTREYVDIVRRALHGEPLRYEGEHFRLPAAGRTGAPLHITTELPRPHIPVYLAAVGAGSLKLAGEIADGWIGVFTSPEAVAEAVAGIRAGRERAGRDMTGFDVLPSLPTAFADDVESAVDQLRDHYVYMLGIGDPATNFYCSLARRMGYEAEMERFTERISAGDRAGAARAVPAGFVDRTAMVGPVPRVAERMREFAQAGVTTLGVMLSPARTDHDGRLRILRQAAEALEVSGVG